MTTLVRGASGSLLRGLALVGVVGFGGGSALIPVIQRELVDRRGILDEEQYLRHTVVANLTPGALPVKLAASAGLAVSGGRLAMLAALVVALPGVLGTVALLALSDALGPSAVRAISYASVGITAFIVVLLLGYIANVHARAGHRAGSYVVITVVVAALTGADAVIRLLTDLTGVALPTGRIPRMGAVEIILASLAVIVAASLMSSHPRGRGPAPTRWTALRRSLRAAGACLLLSVAGVALFVAMGGARGLETGLLMSLSSVTSFGGGEAYVAVADGYFVQNGLVDRSDFYMRLIPIANALPGPILVKVAAGVGYLSGGTGASSWLLAGAAAAATMGACCAVALSVLGAYETVRDHPITVNVGRYILPVICGLLISVSAQMLGVAADVGSQAGVAPERLLVVVLVSIVAMTWFHLRKLVPDLAMLVTAGVVSLLVLATTAG